MQLDENEHQLSSSWTVGSGMRDNRCVVMVIK